MEGEPDEYGMDILHLWGRLHRLQIGIGGWMVTAAQMRGGSAEAADADTHIRDLLEEALAVRARIRDLQPPAPPRWPLQGLPRQARPVGATPPAGVPQSTTGECAARVTRGPAHRAPDL